MNRIITTLVLALSLATIPAAAQTAKESIAQGELNLETQALQVLSAAEAAGAPTLATSLYQEAQSRLADEALVRPAEAEHHHLLVLLNDPDREVQDRQQDDDDDRGRDGEDDDVHGTSADGYAPDGWGSGSTRTVSPSIATTVTGVPRSIGRSSADRADHSSPPI